MSEQKLITDGEDREFCVQFEADIQNLDLFLADCNGILRGKRVDETAFNKVQQDGILLPSSIFGADISGDTAESTGLGFEIGDRDLRCEVIPGTLNMVPWAEGHAQMMITMVDDDGNPFAPNPREVLRRVATRFEELGFYPVVAVELEFYLLDAEYETTGVLAPPINPHTSRRDDNTQVYYMDDLDAYGDFVEAVQEACRIQDVPADGAVAEYAPGQFEINLKHTSNVLKACDDAILLKRIIKNVARKMGYLATFMSKPFPAQAGSGTHIHVSCYGADDENVFLENDDSLRHAIGGLQSTMRDAMLIFSPHANSYRRFQPDLFVPLNASWGYNNRTVALRVPAGPEEHTRIEHRISGADANPYLVTAAVLAGIHYGLVNKLEADEPITGNAYEQTEPTNPRHWSEALELFRHSYWAREYFGEEFHHIYTALKEAEINLFAKEITPIEYSWYLHTV